jgi:hypothetical protein
MSCLKDEAKDEDVESGISYNENTTSYFKELKQKKHTKHFNVQCMAD